MTPGTGGFAVAAAAAVVVAVVVVVVVVVVAAAAAVVAVVVVVVAAVAAVVAVVVVVVATDEEDEVMIVGPAIVTSGELKPQTRVLETSVRPGLFPGGSILAFAKGFWDEFREALPLLVGFATSFNS